MQKNKMGTMPIPQLLGDMALPIMASMLVQALYNIVDSMYIARMVQKEEALSAISISFPLQMLIISVSVGTAVGANALISRLLGEKQREKASDAAKNSIFLCSIYGICFFFFAVFFITPYFNFMTENQTIVTMGSSYSKICLMCAIFPVYSIIGERILQSTGRTIFSMICQMGGALINIALDPIFIFGYFGVPAMGTAGAAIATVLGQSFCFFMVSYFNFKKNPDLDFNFKGFKPDKQIIKDIYKVGLPSIVMQSMGSFMNMGLNSVVASYDVIAVSVLGIYFKLQSFVFMPVFGLANAMISIVSFNYGAKNKARILKTIFLSLVIAAVILTLGTVIFTFFPDWLLIHMFDSTDTMLKIGVPALKTIALGFIPASVAIVLSSSFQAFGNGLYSLFLSFVRQLVVILPVAFILGKIGGLHYVWYAFPLAEITAMIMSLAIFASLYKNKICLIEKEEQE